MRVQLDIDIERSERDFSVSKTVDEGESVVLDSDGDTDWQMEITPATVIQEFGGSGEGPCPVCGREQEEIYLGEFVDDSFTVDEICVSDQGDESVDYHLHFHTS